MFAQMLRIAVDVNAQFFLNIADELESYGGSVQSENPYHVPAEGLRTVVRVRQNIFNGVADQIEQFELIQQS